MNSSFPKDTLYLIYDGECLLCKNTALALKIRSAVGRLEIINARDMHPLVEEAWQKKYDLNAGILVKFHGKYYYKEQALHFLALVGSPIGLLNKLNIWIFSSPHLSKFCYPILKFIRNILLFIRGTSAIANSDHKSLVESLFGANISKIPRILYQRYFIRPYSSDHIILNGSINIKISRAFYIFAPFFRLARNLPVHPSDNLPITVELLSTLASNQILMNRVFYYRDRSTYNFDSKIIHIKDNVVLELMKFGFATKLIYRLKGDKISIDWGGYFFRLGQYLMPLPIGWIIGQFSAFEQALNETQFNMSLELRHPIFGTLYKYNGMFTIQEANE